MLKVLGKKPRSLSRRLTTSFLAVLFAGVFLAASVSVSIMQNLYIQSVRNGLLNQASILRDTVGPLLFAKDLPGLESLVLRIKAETSTRITIIDAAGVVLADSDYDPASMENHSRRPEFQMALLGNTGVSTRISPTLGVKMMYIAIPVISGDTVAGAVRVALPVNAIELELSRRKGMLLASLLVAASLAALAAYAESRRISQPIEAMSKTALEMAGGDLRERHFEESLSEIDMLGDSLNYMAKRLGNSIAELAETNSKLSAILEGSVSGLLIFDSKGHLTDMNRSAEIIIGQTRQDARGKHFSMVLRNTALSGIVKKTLENPATQTIQATLLYRKERTVDASSIPISWKAGHDANGSGALLVLHDITEIKSLEKLRAELVQNVSHELRTPVTIVKGFAETLKDTPPDDPELIREMAGYIYDEAQRLSDLVENLLGLARLESGLVKLQKEELHFAAVCRDVIERLSPLAERKGQTIHLEDKSSGANILGDKEMISTVVKNLLDNAIKYSGDNTAITLCISGLNGGILLSVTDQGPGLDEEDLEKVFQRFYRADTSRTRETGGSGLGLAIVKHAVELHGGRIWAESRKGKGATFYVWLPGGRKQELQEPRLKRLSQASHP